MNPERAEARETNPGPRTSASENAAAGTKDITRTHREAPVQGVVVVLVDAANVADQVLEKRGPTFAAELAVELLAPLRILRAEVAS